MLFTNEHESMMLADVITEAELLLVFNFPIDDLRFELQIIIVLRL